MRKIDFVLLLVLYTLIWAINRHVCWSKFVSLDYNGSDYSSPDNNQTIFSLLTLNYKNLLDNTIKTANKLVKEELFSKKVSTSKSTTHFPGDRQPQKVNEDKVSADSDCDHDCQDEYPCHSPTEDPSDHHSPCTGSDSCGCQECTGHGQCPCCGCNIRGCGSCSCCNGASNYCHNCGCSLHGGPGKHTGSSVVHGPCTGSGCPIHKSKYSTPTEEEHPCHNYWPYYSYCPYFTYCSYHCPYCPIPFTDLDNQYKHNQTNFYDAWYRPYYRPNPAEDDAGEPEPRPRPPSKKRQKLRKKRVSRLNTKALILESILRHLEAKTK